jgi:hypothetical protein
VTWVITSNAAETKRDHNVELQFRAKRFAVAVPQRSKFPAALYPQSLSVSAAEEGTWTAQAGGGAEEDIPGKEDAASASG